MNILAAQQSNNRWRFTGLAGGILAAAAGTALALLMSSCSGTGPSPQVEAEPAPSEFIELSTEAQRNVSLKISEAEERSIQGTLVATGIVAPDQNRLAHIRPLARGVAEEVLAQLGNKVKAGTPLLLYDNIELGELIGDYRNIEAEIRQELAQVEVAKSNLARAESLLAVEAIAQKEYELRDAQYKQAMAMVESKRARFTQVEEKIHRLGLGDDDLKDLSGSEHGTHRNASHSILRAPFEGVITAQDVAPGEMLDQEREAFTLVDTSVVWILADIYEKDLGQVQAERPCRFQVPAYPGETFTGIVGYISDVLDPDSRTAKIRCVVANPNGRLKLEMFATVEIPTAQGPTALAIPEEALQEVDGNPVVFAQRDPSHFETRQVQLGRRGDGWVEVLSGVQKGEKIVSAGSFSLKSTLLREQIGGEE